MTVASSSTSEYLSTRIKSIEHDIRVNPSNPFHQWSIVRRMLLTGEEWTTDYADLTDSRGYYNVPLLSASHQKSADVPRVFVS